MRIILLSGGSGKRLWPLSNDEFPKQFIKFLKNGAGEPVSMLQRVFGQLESAGLADNVIIAANAAQEEIIKEQVGGKVIVVKEPERRNTYPAVALSAAHLYFNEDCGRDEIAVVMSVDPYVDDGFFDVIKQLPEPIRAYEADIALMGAMPTHPSSGYGYIIPADYVEKGGAAGKVAEFKEKPAQDAAREYIMRGGFWNCGVFAFRIGYLLDILAKEIMFGSYEDVLAGYGNIEKTSFDYAVVEKAESVSFIPYNGRWSDIGTWDALTETMDGRTSGNVMMSESCENTYVINELGIPIAALGLKDIIIAAGKGGILITDRRESAGIKDYI